MKLEHALIIDTGRIAADIGIKESSFEIEVSESVLIAV